MNEDTANDEDSGRSTSCSAGAFFARPQFTDDPADDDVVIDEMAEDALNALCGEDDDEGRMIEDDPTTWEWDALKAEALAAGVTEAEWSIVEVTF